MSAIAEKSSIISKTKELCAQIAADSQFKSFQEDVGVFLKDENAKNQYKLVHERGEELHQKQQAGVELGAVEVKAFEDARDSLFENKVAADFMDAQRSLESIQKEITQYIGLTMELGRVPTDEDFEAAQQQQGGCCGGSGAGSCGC